MQQTMLERVAGLAAKVVLREGTVRTIADHGAEFRRFDLDVTGARFAAGQKVQFRVRGVDFRTYTPFDWTESSVAFLIVRHGSGPAVAWADALAPGQTVQMWGPRSAVDLTKLPAPPIFIGDETSFALTAAWRCERSPVVAQLYEVGAAPASAEVLARLGLDPAVLVERSAGDAHRAELAQRAVALVRQHGNASVVLTGNVHSIRAVRDAIKAAGLATTVKAKAHWDPSRKGLD